MHPAYNNPIKLERVKLNLKQVKNKNEIESIITS